MAKRKDVTGQRFGRLVAVKCLGTTWEGGRPRFRYKCRCDCGNFIDVERSSLVHENTRSCGCLREETINKHGMLKGVASNRSLRNLYIKVYVAYHAMRQRCLNPKHTGYKNWGARGIKICDRWLNSIADFLSDVGLPPSPKHTLGRIDNNGNYEPGNVKWDTRREQLQNTRRTNFITINGKTLCLTQWARETGVPVPCLRSRQKRGLTGEDLLRPKGYFTFKKNAKV